MARGHPCFIKQHPEWTAPDNQHLRHKQGTHHFSALATAPWTAPGTAQNSTLSATTKSPTVAPSSSLMRSKNALLPIAKSIWKPHMTCFSASKLVRSAVASSKSLGFSRILPLYVTTWPPMRWFNGFTNTFDRRSKPLWPMTFYYINTGCLIGILATGFIIIPHITGVEKKIIP